MKKEVLIVDNCVDEYTTLSNYPDKKLHRKIIQINAIFCIILSLLIIFIPFVLGQEATAGLPLNESQLEKLQEKTEEGLKKFENLNQNQTKWDYLAEEWRKIFLQNPVMSKLDAFFTKINIVFVILFGEPYSFSLTLLLIVILWILFLDFLGDALSTYSTFSKGISYLISLGITIILGQLSVFKKTIEFSGWLIFSRESTAWRWAIGGVIFLVIILIYSLQKIFGKKWREKKEKAEEKAHRKMEEIAAEASEKSMESEGAD